MPRNTKDAARPASNADRPPGRAEARQRLGYCSLPPVSPRVFLPSVGPGRASLIRGIGTKWVNGTILHYYFFDRDTDGETVTFQNGQQQWMTWLGSVAEKAVVRNAFAAWTALGIGIKFVEVAERGEAEIRIGFMQGDGAWSYIGRDVLGIGPDARTMNFGWSLTHPGEIDTAIHEIGHTLGFPHEHQNPNAGIVWDEEAVYAALAKPPNEWPRETTHYNIIRKIEPDTVQGSNWDPDSIMHYPFDAGLILEPAPYAAGLQPAGGLSPRDRTWVTTFYPPMDARRDRSLRVGEVETLDIPAGGQVNFIIEPAATRVYNIGTFGVSDAVLVLFEDENGNPRYITGDDDSGMDTNALIRVKLFTGRRYILRVRLYSSFQAGGTSVMMW